MMSQGLTKAHYDHILRLDADGAEIGIQEFSDAAVWAAENGNREYERVLREIAERQDNAEELESVCEDTFETKASVKAA